ncbi:hypothetical protein ABQE57_08320 [Mycolicibacterium elephantis]
MGVRRGDSRRHGIVRIDLVDEFARQEFVRFIGSRHIIDVDARLL